ncbi:MAG: mannose-1-phosphate guanylyltransferase/mannose-6-phosphate isomerase [Gammaproteobacteria bacterium]|nr:mannose-1-phosphate guanylyltransferase/mannose-6-phosphate isomerase [Gammaproteobacteria bacterium]
MTQLFPVILCGGSGTRLWPMSREHFPKQLLALTGKESLLQQTVARFPKGMLAAQAPLLVSNEAQRFLVAEQMRQINMPDSMIILEPQAKNTAPAVTLAAQHIVAKQGDGLMLVMPADHVIKQVDVFHQAVKQGIALAEQGSVVTFGIVPTHAETGFGYIKRGKTVQGEACAIHAFVEKPNLELAQQFVASGDYFWNSGMFLFKASVWLKALDKLAPQISACVAKAYAEGRDDIDFFRAHKDHFAASPSDSIDYAVMEHLTENAGAALAQGVVIPLDAGWSDVGSWESLWDVGDKDSDGNMLQGDVYTEQTHDSIILAEQRLVATIGVSNLIVVETPDAVLVADKSQSQQVKNIVNRLKTEKRSEATSHRLVHRPWGTYEGIDQGSRYQVKRIVVKPGAQLSLQMHHHRAEHWIVVSGTARVTRGDEAFLLSENQSTYIPLGVTHRLENPGTIPLELIEVQSGSYLGEDDIVRFDDIYGRQKA